ncbi:MAG: thioredoxin family protein [Phycisphaerales bacterium JB038]
MRKAYRSIQLVALALVCCLGLFSTSQAKAAERTVLYEQFTATWCGYCTYSGSALHQMMDEGYNIAVLQIHVGDAYTTAWGNIRDTKYNVSGIPHVVVDGSRNRVGAGSTLQAYNMYTYDYDWRMGIPTYVTVDVTAVETSPNVYQVTTTLTMDADGTAEDMHVHVLETLWQHPGTAYKVTYCVMQGFDTGTITLNPGETQVVQQTLTLSAASQSRPEDVRFVAFAQAPGAGLQEVYNAGQVDYPFSPPCPGDLDGDNDTDQADLGILLGAYGNNGDGDLDGDGDTDQADLGVLLGDYNCGA